MADYFCCCGPFRTHVVKGARKIAYFEFIVCWIFALIFFFSQRNSVLGVITLIEALTCLLIMISFGRKKHLFYLPFLFLYAIWIVLVVLITIYQIGTEYKLIPKLHYIERKLALIGYSTPDTVGMALYLFGSLVGVLFFLWICSVVFRAFRFLRGQEKAAIGDIVELPKHSDNYHSYHNYDTKTVDDPLKPKLVIVRNVKQPQGPGGQTPGGIGMVALEAMAGPQNNVNVGVGVGAGTTTGTGTETAGAAAGDGTTAGVGAATGDGCGGAIAHGGL